ncbi:MAG: class I SAM-dependent methyltransferase [Candidatus Kerfeldbacteria bacterium]|nr:class I SAM-dependent methyltransferase [Candidatus Kerfeldbacteria bacterium]
MKLTARFSTYFRDKKWQLFEQHFSLHPQTTILDIGYQNKEYQAADNYLEKHYPFPAQITALGIDPPEEFQQRYPQVKTVHYDGRVFPFADNTFDIAWSNATIEHVGPFDRQLVFIKEMARTSRNLFFTTPNRWFPIEVHTRFPFIHWLPRHWFNGIVKLFGKDWAAGDYMFLLSSRQLKRLLAASGIERYTLIRQRFCGFTLQFIVIVHHSSATHEDTPNQ